MKFNIRLPLSAPEGDAPTTTSGDPGGDTKLSIGQRLTSALASKEALTAKIGAHEATIAEHVATIAARDAVITDLQAQLATVSAENVQLKASEAEVEEALKKSEDERVALAAKEQDLAKRSSAEAKQIVQSVGIDAKKLPAAEDTKAVSPEDQIRALKGEQRVTAALHFKQHGKLPDFMKN